MVFFFFNDTATTEIYTLSLHDALPISFGYVEGKEFDERQSEIGQLIVGHGVLTMGIVLQRAHSSAHETEVEDRKSTRLNSSHANISYAVFCLKKKTLYDTHFASR